MKPFIFLHARYYSIGKRIVHRIGIVRTDPRVVKKTPALAKSE